MASRIVRCRAGRSRPPPVSSGSRCSSRVRSAAGGRTLTRAAASSMASGSPSSRRQMAATAAALSVRQREVRLHRRRPLDKERHRRDLRQLLERRQPVGSGQRQGQQRKLVLAPHMERLATGGEDGQARTGCQEGGDLRRGREHPLAVVQDQQQPLWCEERARASRRSAARRPPGRRARRRPWAPPGQDRSAGEIDEDDPVGKRLVQPDRQPRSPVASCPRRRVRSGSATGLRRPAVRSAAPRPPSRAR